MTLYLIGLGLGDEKDVTVRGLELIKKCDHVYLEQYTSILGVDKERLENYYGRSVEIADRDLVEQGATKALLAPAKKQDVALLVVGDPFGATTHTDLVLRAKEAGVKVVVVHNASVLNAIGVVGLELYKFGLTTSIPYWSEGFEPETFYDAIKENRARGLHTLCLLDIKISEPSKEELLAGKRSRKKKVEPRFMTVTEALDTLLAIEARRGEGVINDSLLVVGVARLGQEDAHVVAGTLAELRKVDLGGPLHSLIIPGKLHDVEKEALAHWKAQ